jgi:iron complex outermembrane receptor protein
MKSLSGLIERASSAAVIAAMTGAAAVAAAQESASASQSPDGKQSSPAAAPAQQLPQLEEVIVTAEKRAENLQNVPIAISAFSGDAIEQAGVTGIENLKQLSPSLQFGKGPIDNFVSMRGIGAELINVSAEAGVSIAQDGVPFSSQTMFDADFLDVERVEVLRGPQGTIAGRNATGGTINIYSRRPTPEFAGQVKASVGNYSRKELEGFLSGPIVDGVLLGRLAVRGARADGWLTNAFSGEDFNNADDVKVRGSLLADVTQGLEAQLIFEHSRDGSSPMLVALGRARPDTPSYPEAIGVPEYDREHRVFSANYPSNRRVETDKATLRLTWDIAPASTLTSVTGYVSNDNSGQFGGSTLDPSVVFDFLATDVWQLSQELTFTTDLTDRQDLIVGGLYLHSKAHEPLAFGVPPALPVDAFKFTADQDLDSYAVYGQWRYRFTDRLRLSIGARYTQDSKDYFENDSVTGFPLPVIDTSKSWRAFTPRFALDYVPTSDMMFYASVSRGFKAGGINAFATSDGSFDEYEPEFIWNHEVGMKANWLNSRLKTTIAGFYMDYTNVQQNLRILNTQTGILLPNVVNASDATISGIEAGLDAQVTDRFRLAAAGTWLDAKYDRLVTNDLVYPELGERDLSGNRLARAPEWQFSVSGEYGISLGSSLGALIRADYGWQSRTFFSFYNHELNSQKAYGLLNLTVGVGPKDGRWQLAAFARNLTDTDYVIYAEANVAAGFPSLGGAVGPPRMYGLSLAYNF